jgi:hypothetical protein
MTVPGTDTLRGPSAVYAREELWPSAELGLPPGLDRPGARDWPLCSYLELPALPVSARSARLHARNILRAWDLEALFDTVELLVSELVTNAVRAAALIAPQPGEAGPVPSAPQIRFWLTSNRASVVIQVWDGDRHHPVCQDEGLEAEAGRGLLLVETLSAQWGCCASDRQAGKVVWALVQG